MDDNESTRGGQRFHCSGGVDVEPSGPTDLRHDVRGPQAPPDLRTAALRGVGQPSEDGFTLVEIMVVLLILAILLAIAIPTFLGVTGGANDRSAQVNLNTALTALKAQVTPTNQSYSAVTSGVMTSNEPELSWSQSTTSTAATVATTGPVDFYTSADGNGVVVVDYSKNLKGCWYAVDNRQAVVDTVGSYGTSAVPGGDTTHVPTGAGTWYGKGSFNNGTTPATSCDPAKVPVGATWGSTFPS